MLHRRVLLLAFVLMTGRAIAQAPLLTDVFYAQTFAEQVKRLRVAAGNSDDGVATETLENYPKHYSMLTVRLRSGAVERDANYDELTLVLNCTATVTIGGKVVDAKTATVGKIGGSRLEGAPRSPLFLGTIVHIPADTPHQMLIEPGKSCAYYTEKIVAK